MPLSNSSFKFMSSKLSVTSSQLLYKNKHFKFIFVDFVVFYCWPVNWINNRTSPLRPSLWEASVLYSSVFSPVWFVSILITLAVCPNHLESHTFSILSAYIHQASFLFVGFYFTPRNFKVRKSGEKLNLDGKYTCLSEWFLPIKYCVRF